MCVNGLCFLLLSDPIGLFCSVGGLVTIMLGSRSTQEMSVAWGIAVAISISVEFFFAQPLVILIRAAIDVRNRLRWAPTRTLPPNPFESSCILAARVK